MLSPYFRIILFFGFMSFIDMFVDSLCQQLSAKRAHYNCSKCSNWRCMSCYCKNKERNYKNEE